MQIMDPKCIEWIQNAKIASEMQIMVTKCTDWIQNAKIASKMQIMVTKMHRMDPKCKECI